MGIVFLPSIMCWIIVSGMLGWAFVEKPLSSIARIHLLWISIILWLLIGFCLVYGILHP
ncbi:hypothetical protein SAMN02745166_02594 [Prosthecobacter debontii]|uniref:Uncharacterized protein n=1 Tax=Prosthecobacter debontii TaxID=48467 RepID=A0A1T4Y7R1_9BACT|nr:hypothetical protein SAMN02745166_02594 [Prosthecobacter debontii]